MRIAVTGGTGFVGGHLAASLAEGGHEVVVVARRSGAGVAHERGGVTALPGVHLVHADLSDEAALERAFEGCEAVAHCAGINRETASGTYEAVHVRGTEHVVKAAEAAGVRRLVLVSFLRARPGSGSPYHESKWAAEEIVRSSSLDWTVVKPGVIYGRGDHLLDHLSRALALFPVYAGVGPRRLRPLAVEDVVRVLEAGLVDGALRRKTVALLGPTELSVDDVARLVARVSGSRARFVRAPLAFHRVVARVAEAVMEVPLVSTAQVRILEEEGVEAACAPDVLPPGLEPSTPFDEASVSKGLPADLRLHLSDLRWFAGGPGGTIRLATEVAAPRERCFDLARSIELHQRSQARSGERAVAGVTSGLIGGGQWVSWRARHFGVPWRMTSTISEFARPAKFVDEMERGPFARWRHEHRFEDRGGTTRMTDTIDYELPLGLLGRLADTLFLKRYLTGLVRRHNEAVRVEAEAADHQPAEEDEGFVQR